MGCCLKRISKEDAARICDDQLWKRIAEDGVTRENGFIDGDLFLGISVDDQTVGFFVCDLETTTTLNVHINMLNEHRKHGKEAANLFLDWAVEKGFEKVNCEIPECYPEVIKFAMDLGFKHEGTNRSSIRKNGELIDQHRFGINKYEIQFRG